MRRRAIAPRLRSGSETARKGMAALFVADTRGGISFAVISTDLQTNYRQRN
jgi:hypothetical protein